MWIEAGINLGELPEAPDEETRSKGEQNRERDLANDEELGPAAHAACVATPPALLDRLGRTATAAPDGRYCLEEQTAAGDDEQNVTEDGPVHGEV